MSTTGTDRTNANDDQALIAEHAVASDNDGGLAPSSTAAHGCVVSIAENATGGPGRLIPRPARQLQITPRNSEALRRLALIAEGRHTLDQRNSVRTIDHAEPASA